ncbi:uncharacterized protein LOC132730373 [Ruditapes philippinarum]|uniref:uncharacterized protein LOC132730373 n=1 Tax=Ruditapes philippinarum TaxID=129788 RepID=UPI00295B64D0|nr:uncharacterized protein LOC132730373 [Ruditapes philippinarum]
MNIAFLSTVGLLFIVSLQTAKGCDKTPRRFSDCSTSTSSEWCYWERERRKRYPRDWDGLYYSVDIKDNPCLFGTYDHNHDGTIVKDEMYAVLGNTEKSNGLFKDMDKLPTNGGIDEEEFIAMSNMIIKECVEFNE